MPITKITIPTNRILLMIKINRRLGYANNKYNSITITPDTIIELKFSFLIY